ncbi:hypothetical protein Salat_2129900 [Sesamum alatum]|uniref:Uncharacterized protein n=1 Tax=Sesamum alatum TaxID=300844 RepID=A0AAE1Y133_9LAMI|nr:hypothetical protein Salat_2129900 [Sesamum alatum]
MNHHNFNEQNMNNQNPPPPSALILPPSPPSQISQSQLTDIPSPTMPNSVPQIPNTMPQMPNFQTHPSVTANYQTKPPLSSPLTHATALVMSLSRNRSNGPLNLTHLTII